MRSSQAYAAVPTAEIEEDPVEVSMFSRFFRCPTAALVLGANLLLLCASCFTFFQFGKYSTTLQTCGKMLSTWCKHQQIVPAFTV
jgi:hypothetical protein